MTCSVPQTLMSLHLSHLSKPLVSTNMKDRASSPFGYLSKLSHHLPYYLSYIFFSFHMTIPCLPSWLLQISSVKSHLDHVRRMYPTTPFTGCSRALEANVYCLLQTAACFANPLHEQEKPRNWYITGMVISSWWGRVLTGQINLPKSGNIHLLKPLVYFLFYFPAPYLLSSSSLPGLFPPILSFSAVAPKSDF